VKAPICPVLFVWNESWWFAHACMLIALLKPSLSLHLLCSCAWGFYKDTKTVLSNSCAMHTTHTHTHTHTHAHTHTHTHTHTYTHTNRKEQYLCPFSCQGSTAPGLYCSQSITISSITAAQPYITTRSGNVPALTQHMLTRIYPNTLQIEPAFGTLCPPYVAVYLGLARTLHLYVYTVFIRYI